MYGLTECKRVSYLPPEYLLKKPDSVGLPIPNCEAKVLDDAGCTLQPGEVGELVIRGANVMQGYWNKPEATAQTFREGATRNDTWLYSGDLFRQDEEGFLYFVSRKDDLIKTKGERVSPKEIEDMLCSMEGVAEAAAIGVPDDISGQAIKVFIVKNGNSEVTESAVLSYCNQNLEPFMIPKYVEFCDAMPKTPTGKIDKKMLSSTVSE
jgi:acyl-CoA synthetase (AMP-forming)/AMP-acid ligase II